MKQNIETGAKVINFLASCGKDKIEIMDLFAEAVDAFEKGDDLNEAYGMVRGTLHELAVEDMVTLSEETITSVSRLPGIIHIRPRMRKAAKRLML